MGSPTPWPGERNACVEAGEKRVAATRAQARADSLRGTYRVAELFLLCPFCANMLITAGTVGR
jgi:hypothetical protein